MTDLNWKARAGKLMKNYEAGVLTAYEMFECLLQLVTDENFQEWRAMLPDEVFAKLVWRASECPHTDEEWAKYRVVYIGTFTGTPEEYQRMIREDIGMMRRGVEAIRRANGEVT